MWEEDDDAEPAQELKSRYCVAELPLRLPALRAPMDKPDPKMGIGERSHWAPASRTAGGRTCLLARLP